MNTEECPCCHKKCKIETYRRLCQYNDDATNWLTSCKECKLEDDSHWKEMWKDYYESQGVGGFY